MKKLLFYAAANRFSIGDIATVHISMTRDISQNGTPSFSIRDVVRDEYGVATVEVKTPIISNLNWPVVSFRLLNPDGSTGFGSEEKSESFLSPFIRGAYLLVGHAPFLLSLDEDEELSRGPLSLSTVKAAVPCAITFHGCDGDKLRNFWNSRNDFPSRKEPEFWVDAILGSLVFCDFLTIWSWAFGDNPTIVSRSMAITIERIGQDLRSTEHEMIEIPEFALPEW